MNKYLIHMTSGANVIFETEAEDEFMALLHATAGTSFIATDNFKDRCICMSSCIESIKKLKNK